MALKSALLWSVSQSLVKLVAGFVSIKVTAVFLGPVGLALVGQLSNFVSLLHGTATNAIQTGVTKMTAQNAGHPERLAALWSTAMRMSLVVGCTLAILVGVSSRSIAHWLFQEPTFWPVLIIVAVSLPALAVGSVLISAINGLRQIALLGLVNIGAAVMGAVIFVPLSFLFGVWGGLIGTSIAYVSTVIVSWMGVALQRQRTRRTMRVADFLANWSPEFARGIVALVPMLLVHAVAELMTPLLIRDAIAGTRGLHDAGLWQATVRLADTYTLLLTTALSMYLLPHLSCLEGAAFRREVMSVTAKVSLLTGGCALAIWSVRQPMVSLLFTPQFAPVGQLLRFQLAGDVCKLACWPLRMALVVQSKSYWYMGIDVFIAISQVVLTYLWLGNLGLEGATLAYACAYALTALMLIVLQRRAAHAGK